MSRTRLAKLLPPPLPPGLLERPALVDRLDQAAERRLTLVLAGAGFGKSTLLSSWSRRRPSAWYTVDDTDANPAVLFAGLTATLQRCLPGMSSELATEVLSTAGPDASATGRPGALAALLCERLEEHLTEDLVLVLDDVHTVGRPSPALDLLQEMCRQAPHTLHLVLASQTDLGFSVERLRGQGQVLELFGPALSFTPAETEAVLRHVSGSQRLHRPTGGAPQGDREEGDREDGGLEADQLHRAERLHESTGGWPAAVRLAAEALQHLPTSDGLSRLTVPGGALFEYLVTEVLGRESRDVQDLVQRATGLERFNAGLLEALGVHRAAQTLAELDHRGLFVQHSPGPGGWYALSPLLRETAPAAFPLHRAERQRLARLAVDWLLANGLTEDALRSALLADDRETVARLLEEHGAALLRTGAVGVVAEAGRRLGPTERTPAVDEVVGQARQIQGDWEGALESFERAAGDRVELEPGLAWRMGLLHYLQGDYERALAVYALAALGTCTTADEALLLAWNASAHFVRNEIEPCRALAAAAMTAAGRSGDPSALAAAHTVVALVAALDGDRQRNEDHYRRALEAAERAGDVLQMLRVRTNRGSRATEEGAYAEAVAELEVAVRLAETTGFAFFHALALSNRGEAKLGLGQLDEALTDFAHASDLWRRGESRSGAFACVGFGDAYRLRGDLSLAQAAYREALALAEPCGDFQTLVPALAGLARVLAADDPAEAGVLTARALTMTNGLVLVRAVLADGWVAVAGGDDRTASTRAAEARAAAMLRRDRPGLAESLELQARSAGEPSVALDALAEAAGIWRSLDNPIGQARVEMARAGLASRSATAAEAHLASLGVRTGPGHAAGLVGDLRPRARRSVAVQALGGFRVLRAGQPVQNVEWQSRKARDALKILVARRGHPAPRDVLVDHLWPDDAAALGNRLSVTLSTLRAVLDPQRSFPSDHFIAADKGAVWLDLDHLDVDVERFFDRAEAGLAAAGASRPEALGLLTAAETAYSGEFCEEDLYADWALSLRENARATYLAVARALAEGAAATGRWDDATRYQLRLLEHDPYDEQAHLGLVGVLSDSGRHGEARRRYRLYVARMAELGVEAAVFRSAGT